MIGQQRCSSAVHHALAADDAAWSKLEFAGYQDVEADGDDPDHRQEVRFCACGSTLARRVRRSALEQISELIRNDPDAQQVVLDHLAKQAARPVKP